MASLCKSRNQEKIKCDKTLQLWEFRLQFENVCRLNWVILSEVSTCLISDMPVRGSQCVCLINSIQNAHILIEQHVK